LFKIVKNIEAFWLETATLPGEWIIISYQLSVISYQVWVIS
jgi:hypothetical protein